ncbi:MAG: glycosyltransferase family 39 protein [Acidobacteriota bacterium]
MTRPAWLRVLRLLAGVISSTFLLEFLWIAASRAGYPYDLEFQEGGVVEHARRILAGQPLYPPPSIDFVPYIYPPLYFWTSAQVMRIAGVGARAARLVSIVSTLATFALLFHLVHRQTKDRLAGLVTAGLYAACFPVCLCWYDLARVDSLFLALCLAAAPVIVSPTRSTAAIAGTILGIAFLAKQQALPLAAGLAIALVPAGTMTAMIFVAAFGAVALGFTLAANAWTHGLYIYYVLEVPAGHALRPWAASGFWRHDLGRNVPILVGLAAALAIVRGGDETRGSRRIALGLLGGGIAASWSGRLHQGGAENVLMPAMAALALAAGLLLGRARSFTAQGAILALLVAQLGMRLYDPRAQVPTAADRAAGDRLVAELARMDGDVLVADHGFLGVQAGKPAHAHGMALNDLERSRAVPPGGPLTLDRDLRAAIDARRFSLIVLDGMSRFWKPALQGRYEKSGDAFSDPDVFWTRTGVRTRPRLLCRPSPAG